MLKGIFNNPEIIRNSRYRLRQKTVILTIVVTMILFIFIGIMALGPSRGPMTESWHALFIVYASFALIVGYFYGTGLTATSIIGEKDKKTYDFLFMTPLSDTDIAIGKLIGSTVHMWLILAIMTLFLVISALAGGINGIRFIIFYLTLISGALFCSSLGLLVSVSINKIASSFIGVGILIILFIFSSSLGATGSDNYWSDAFGYLKFLGLLSPFAVLWNISGELNSDSGRYQNIISFFNFGINGGWFTVLLYLWFGYWIMRAVIRRIRNLQGVYLTPIETIIFFGVLEVLLIGFQWKYARYDITVWASLATYLLINGLLLIILFSFLTLSREGYFNYVRNRLANKSFGLLDKRTPPHLLCILLCVLVMLGVFIMTAGFSKCGVTLTCLEIWVLIALVSIFYLLVQWLKTILVNTGTLVSIIILMVVLGLPPMVVAIFNLADKTYLYLNPIAYITATHHYGELSHLDLWFHPVLLGVILIGMLCLFLKRHSTIKKIVQHRMEL